MDYDFGDIIDARNNPNIKHFIVVVGEVSTGGRSEVMYYWITSRVYVVFADMLSFFNDCLSKNYKRFEHFFSKEKGKPSINQQGMPSEALFLSHDDYSGHLTSDSAVIVNQEPYLGDKKVFDALHKSGKHTFVNKLTKLDMQKVLCIMRHSLHISDTNKVRVVKSYNKV